ncbi:MAG: DNA internalization-related competence protein ComEC/Rec2 [Nitrospirae bacterium]|nr:DNA internalization-related competence protein ComEC/Rec2 [Nitrospirota bacterium]
MQKPIIPLTLAYITGLLLGHGFLYFPYSIGCLLIVGILISGILIWLDKLNLRRTVLIMLPCFIGMTAYLYSAAWFPSDHYTRHIKPDKENREVIGKITSPLDRDPDRTGFVVDVQDIDGTRVSGKVRVSVREEVSSVGYGDVIRVTGKLYEPGGYNNPGGFDYPAYLARSNIYYIVNVKSADAIDILSRGSGIFRKIQDWRERIRQAFLESTTGDGSAILQAMVLGEEGRLTDELRDRFMAAGVTHIISISGSHLGMVAVLCFALIRGLLFMMPERFYHRLTLYTDPKIIAAWLTLPLVVFYTLLAGGQMATVRSLIMISAGLFAIILDRENALMHALALAALFILIASPQAIFDISFQLSFIAVLVIGYVVSLWNELQFKAETRYRKIRNSALLLIIISLSTSLATGPLVAFYFNQISFAGIVSNLIIVPFAGMVVVPLGLLSGIVSLFTHHLPLGWLNQLVSDLFISAVSFFPRLPFAEFHPPAPSLLWLMLYAVFLISLFMHTRARLLFQFKPFESSSRVSRLPVIGMAFAGVCLLLLFVLSFIPEKRMLVSFPDVGQGDCALIELPGGQTILIDGGGTRDNRFSIGRRVLAPWLWNKGIRRLDLVVLSHPHPDHMNGLIAILNKFEVTTVWESGLDAGLPGYGELRAVMQDRKIRPRLVSADDPPAMLGKTMVSVLHPRRGFDPHDRQAYAAENNRSLVVQIKSEDGTLLFTGDIGIEAEQDILKNMRGIKTDLIKVPHHGSKSSSSEDFLSQTSPEIAVVTVGRGNPYRHPSDEVVARYEKIGARICRTDIDGAVTIGVNKGKYAIQRWNGLILQRIALSNCAAWGEQEQVNWSRLRIRATEL